MKKLNQLLPPLIDLHRHLDGNIRIETILALAEKHKLDLPTYTYQSLKKYVHIQHKTPSLMAFLEKLNTGISVLADYQACYQIAYENVEDAVNEGLNYLELRFSPTFMASAHHLEVKGVCQAVVEGVKDANRAFNYNARLIGILSRTYGTSSCHRELDAILHAQKYANEIVAVDLAGDELSYPAKDFVEHFNRVRDRGLNITIHAGEACGPQSIWDAISLLGADRIGHGVSASSDPQLLTYMARHNIGVEACILSNYHTGAWTNIAEHPVSTFLKYDIPVFLNTDDPGVSANTLSDEYQLAKNTVKLSTSQLNKCKWNAYQQAFLSDTEKKSLISI